MSPDPQARRHAFDRMADWYATARPPYPPLVYQLLTTHCGLGPGCRVLEIGPGTGQATAELLAQGGEVVAVEPGPALAGMLTQRLGGERLTVVVNDFEAAAVPPGPYQLAVSATAFHWLDPAIALPKLAGLLGPGGWLVVWWTVFGDPDRPSAFRTRLNRLYRQYLPHEARGPDHRPGPLRTASWAAELRQGGWFGPVEVDLIRWTHRLTPQGARNLWDSFPNVAELTRGQREAFLTDLAGVVEDLGGAVDDAYVTAVYRTRPVRGE